VGIIRKLDGNLQVEKGIIFRPSGPQDVQFFLSDQWPGPLALLAQPVVSPGPETAERRQGLQIFRVRAAWVDASLFA
jgi:hypothetical protein